MKALSIRQPWAWLIVEGFKDIENRDWPTTYRGRVLIHASRTMTRADFEACCIFLNGISTELAPDVLRCLHNHMNYEFFHYMRGGIVGETTIVDCVTDHASPWFCGDYGFVLADSKPLYFQPCAGALKFFTPTLTKGKS